MKKANNPIKEILSKAGRYSDFSNRSFYTKALNAAILTGLVSVEICDEGKVWTLANSFKANIKVKAGGFVRWAYRKTNKLTPGDILPIVGKLLLDENVKKVINADVNLRADYCRKCDGNGIIPQFHYYCSGICFDCGGTGRNMSKEKTSVEVIGKKENPGN